MSKYNLTKWLKTQFLIPYPSRPPSANFPIYRGRFFLPMENYFQVLSALGRPFRLTMYGVISELGKAPFFASWIVLSNPGTVKSSLFCSILSDTLVENWATCFRMYRRNESLRHLPMIIIVSGDTPARYISISDPERRECAPISMGPKPNHPLPRILTAACNFVRITAEVIVNIFPFISMKVLT